MVVRQVVRVTGGGHAPGPVVWDAPGRWATLGTCLTSVTSVTSVTSASRPSWPHCATGHC